MPPMSTASEAQTVSMADPDPAPGADGSELFDELSEVSGYERSPLDVLRVLLFAAAAIGVAVVTKYLRDGVDGLEENLTALVDVPWAWLRVGIDVLLVATVTIVGVGLLLLPLLTRRFRLFGYVLAASVLTTLVGGAVAAWVGLGTQDTVTNASADELARGVSTDAVGSAQLVAVFVAISPFVSRRWRRAGAWLVTAVIVMRIVVADNVSTHAVFVLTIGASVGTLVLLAFGRPTTRPRLSAIVEELRASGLPVAEMHPASVDARGSVPYFATLEDGSGIFVKVLGADQRAADLLFRLYRGLRLRNVGDERPFSSLRRTVEHEALVALQARDVGVRTPRLRGVAPVGRDSFLLAYDMIDGTSLDGVDESRLTDDVLEQLWGQVAKLRQFRIAHRDLRLANVFLGDDDRPWIIDFGFSEIAASDALLRSDVAQLLTSLALSVGAERAVAPALAALGPEAVAESLGRLQPAALSGATQTRLKQSKGLLDEVRGEIERRCAVEEPPLEPVTRFGARQIFTLVMLVAVFYFLIPQLADLPGVLGEIKDANWAWLAPILAASAATYLAATLALFGSVPTRLPAGPTAAAQVASVVCQQGGTGRARWHGAQRPLPAASGHRLGGGHLVGRPQRDGWHPRPPRHDRDLPDLGGA